MHVFVKPQSFRGLGRKCRREHEKWLQAHLPLGLLGWPRAGTAMAGLLSLGKAPQGPATRDPYAGK